MKNVAFLDRITNITINNRIRHKFLVHIVYYKIENGSKILQLSIKTYKKKTNSNHISSSHLKAQHSF